MNTKRILHVTYDMRIGGTEMVIKNIIEGADESMFDMSIFCIEEPIGPWGEELQNNGVVIYSKNRKEGFDTSLIVAIREVVKAQHIDVIHCHQYTPWVYGVLASIGLTAKVIFTEHGRFYPDSSSWKRRIVNPLLSFFTVSITAISKATKQALVNYEFLPEDKVRLIYNGIKALEPISNFEIQALKRDLSILPENIVLGTVARLDPIKNHMMMLKAFSEVIKECNAIKLIIVGDGELMHELQKKCTQLSIDKHVVFTGYITKPGPYIQLFDIFLLSSLSEGTSMTLLEAMSVSKPCVVTDAGGNKEIVRDNVNGFVTENGNTQEFKMAIIKTLSLMNQNQRIGEQSYSLFKKRFTQKEMKFQYQKLYTEI